MLVIICMFKDKVVCITAASFSYFMCNPLTESSFCRQGALTGPVTASLPEPSAPTPTLPVHWWPWGKHRISVLSLTRMGLWSPNREMLQRKTSSQMHLLGGKCQGRPAPSWYPSMTDWKCTYCHWGEQRTSVLFMFYYWSFFPWSLTPSNTAG